MTSPAPPGAAPLDPQALFAALPGNYVLLAADADFTMLAVTDAHLAAIGGRREDTVGRPLFDTVPDSETANLRASLEQVLETRAAERTPLRRFDIRTAEGALEER